GGARFEPARAGAVLGDSVVKALRGTFWRNNLLAASPELVTSAVIDRDSRSLVGTWFAYAPDAEGWTTGIPSLHPTWRITGRWPRDSEAEIALGGSALGPRKLGDSVVVEIGGVRRALTLTGIVSTGGLEDQLAWAPLARVQEYTNRSGQADRVWLSAL